MDPERFAPSPAPPWQWRLLYCGRIDPRKGIETAVRALPLLPAAATLVIDGPGDTAHAGELRALADDGALRAALVRGGAATAGRLSERAFVGGLVAELEGAVAAGAIR